MENLGIQGAPTRGFISYRRIDNDDFGKVVDEIARTLSALFEARTGQSLRLFLDRDSIGWGEDWREAIDSSVRQSTLFIPIITMRYFNSQPCLDELFAFESTARNLGVTDLILPLVLFGSDQIREDDERTEVQLISRLNYRSLEEAYEAGYHSPEWRKLMSQLAKELADALSRTEDALARADVETAMLPGRRSERAVDATAEAAAMGEDDDPLGDFDLLQLGVDAESVSQLLTDVGSVFEEFTDIASAFEVSDGMSAGQVNARLLRFAKDVTGPSRRLEDSANNAEGQLRAMDPKVREWVRQLSSFDFPEAQDQLSSFLESLGDPGDMEGVENTISQVADKVKWVSLMNVNVRKALRPAVRGLRAMSSAISIYRGWQELAK